MNKAISECRSEVIEAFINIEWIINAIISQYFFKSIRTEFIFEFLYDINCSFSLKRNVLKKIAPSFDKLEDLNRLNNIRNYFAHCNKEIFESNGYALKRGRVLDPKNINKELDFEKLHEEFKSKQGEVENSLKEIFESLDGQLLAKL